MKKISRHLRALVFEARSAYFQVVNSQSDGAGVTTFPGFGFDDNVDKEGEAHPRLLEQSPVSEPFQLL
jgi:hypothetical protein